MNTNSIYALIDVMIVGCGIYIIYLYAMMVKTREIKESILMPKGLEGKKCKDPDGYIRFIGVKQLLFGIIAVISGGIGLAQDLTSAVGLPVYMVMVVVFLGYIVWYCVQIKKAEKLFW